MTHSRAKSVDHVFFVTYQLQFQGCRSPIHFRKLSATDGTKPDLNIGETRLWRLDSRLSLQGVSVEIQLLNRSRRFWRRGSDPLNIPFGFQKPTIFVEAAFSGSRVESQYTGWLIDILIMVYYNPYITGWYNPLYNLTNQVFFIAHMIKCWIFLGLAATEGEKKLFGEAKNVLSISKGGSLHVCHFCSFILLRPVNSYYPLLRTVSYNHLLNSLLKNTQAHPRSGAIH